MFTRLKPKHATNARPYAPPHPLLLARQHRVKTWASWKGHEAGGLGEAHEDVLIVAGDISSSVERLGETLSHLKERYDEVRDRNNKKGTVSGGEANVFRTLRRRR